MTDFTVRSDSVDVEQIMRQIRARIREKRGADYTETELRELASVKLEKFLDPRGVRSDLVKQFGRPRAKSPEPPKYEFGENTMYETHRGVLRAIRRVLHPILKLFINPAPLVHALNVQTDVNQEFHRRFREQEDTDREPLFFEVIHNLVLEVTRLGIEVHNLKMRVESLSSRVDFDERRGRSLENVVQYRAPVERRPAPPTAGAGPEAAPRAADRAATGEASPPGPVAAAGASPAPGASPGGDAQRRRRRRRRRRPGHTLADGPGRGGGAGPDADPGDHEDAADASSPSAGDRDAGGAEPPVSPGHPDSSSQ